jgi:hypothetical protein
MLEVTVAVVAVYVIDVIVAAPVGGPAVVKDSP